MQDGLSAKFRDAMARLQAAGSPSEAIEHGFYIERPGRSAVSVISARLELVSTASFLLVGGIGSGKTTELLMTAKTLNDLGDTRAFYVDVSTIHDIKKMPAGTLTVVAGLELAKQIPKRIVATSAGASISYRRALNAAQQLPAGMKT